jgi:hypothetical protein
MTMKERLPGTSRTSPDLVKTYKRWRGRGHSPAQAAKKVERSPSWAYRLEKRLREGSAEEPAPEGPEGSDALKLVAAFRKDFPLYESLRRKYGLPSKSYDLVSAFVLLVEDLIWTAAGGEDGGPSSIEAYIGERLDAERRAWLRGPS